MIAWPIAAAAESGCFERIVVSTDDEEIAAIAQDLGAEVPFLRPGALADDLTPTIPVIRHAVEALTVPPDAAVCCIYPTAPFVSAGDLRRGLERLEAEACSFVFPVAPYASPIQRALRRDAAGHVEMFDPAAFDTRSQDLEEAWHDAAQFYWATAATWSAGGPIFGPGAVGIGLPRYRVQDIDTEDDWTRAELMFQALNVVRPEDRR
jgi:N-acylneuraminate cytidylyltransferase